MNRAEQRVVIVGGGFAGVETALRLRRTLPAHWKVVLYSRENHLCFSPLLPEVVGASLNPLHVVWSLREMLPGVICRTAPVTALDFDARTVEFEDGGGTLTREGYDHLVLALGLPVRLEIIEGMGEFGWPIKTLGDASALRNHLIAQLERAEVTSDSETREGLLSVAVVGGGFTGVEVAGAILDLFRDSCAYYSSIEAADIQVHLLEGSPRILGPLPEDLSAFARQRMEARGMQIREGTGVEAVTADGIRLSGGEMVRAGTVISAVGNGTYPLLVNSGLELERGRLVVSGDMRVEGREGVWALGDCAAVPNAMDGSISPTLAQYATRQAEQLAENICASIRGGVPQPFSYSPQGMFCLIGHRNAVGQVYGRRLSGFTAWLLWHVIYWAKMPTLARKVQIAVDWLWGLCFPRDIVELSMEQTRDIEAKHGKPL
ncbi:NAD(P)/FAD-dependent oxidoreductase [Myxococcota bacterium]|nr:NAD(P)/FAD-dependent oxidoreductase [Myxococcota bacterium]